MSPELQRALPRRKWLAGTAKRQEKIIVDRVYRAAVLSAEDATEGQRGSIGALLRAREKAKGVCDLGTHRGTTRRVGTTSTLADLGITEHQSAGWQTLADWTVERSARAAKRI